MRETIVFRVPEANAERFLPADVGSSTGIVRILELDVGDPLLLDIKRAEQQLREEGRAFYTAWDVRRRYNRSELENADLLHVWPKRVFEPAGEECGTTYDDSEACPECGAGALQTSPLFLDGRRIPKRVDFVRTIAGEIVVSSRVVETVCANELSGVEFEAVRLSNNEGMLSEDYFQLRVVGQPVDLDPVTRAGDDPFDEDGYGRCSKGDVVGLNLLSEVTVKGETIPSADVMTTRQMIGVRRGLLRPQPMLLLSPRAWRTIEEAMLKRLVVEVAHVLS